MIYLYIYRCTYVEMFNSEKKKMWMNQSSSEHLSRQKVSSKNKFGEWKSKKRCAKKHVIRAMTFLSPNWRSRLHPEKGSQISPSQKGSPAEIAPLGGSSQLYSKWIKSMVNGEYRSPGDLRLFPFQKAFFMPYKWEFLTTLTNWDPILQAPTFRNKAYHVI